MALAWTVLRYVLVAVLYCVVVTVWVTVLTLLLAGQAEQRDVYGTTTTTEADGP